MEDIFGTLERQIERLLSAVIKLKEERKRLSDENSSLRERVSQLEYELDSLKRENEMLRNTAQGSEEAKSRLDSLLRRINEVLGEET
ncbi:hypothetical protein DRQ27_04645 [bacterium]|nr:MAG: hypothetical protein DRQ27_04645 [bacterium]